MGARGPLPDPNARRRNKPTIPTTNLPASGRKGPAPRVPKSFELRKAGKEWWSWAWHTPQAAAWDDGVVYAVARRAQLEDDLIALAGSPAEDAASISEMLGIEEDKRVRELSSIFASVRRVAGGEMSVMKEMRELDDRLGLTPKALAQLRWSIVDDGVAEPDEKPAATASASGRRARLSVVK